ncbi:MAG: hypothetical protein WDM92_03645 [Caulobacteraceae bacterium]
MSKTEDHVVVDGSYLAREARIAVRTFFAPLTALVAAATTIPPSTGAPAARRKPSGHAGAPHKKTARKKASRPKASTDRAAAVAD